MSEATPTIFVVDDDASYLASLARLLRAAGYEVRPFSSAEEFLAQLADVPGCLIADLRMPGLSGLELQEALARNAVSCAPPVILLTGYGDVPTAVRAMREGAEDYLTKDAPKAELIGAIERALVRDMRQRAEHARLRDLRAGLDSLTPREREVLQHVVRGRLNKQIAGDLGISERTVKAHRTAITTKLRVRSAAGLTRLVLDARGEASPTLPKEQ